MNMDEKSFRTWTAKKSADVLAFYDSYASTWDKRFANRRSTGEFHRIRLESFLRVAKLNKKDRIVELGVGTGPYLDVISRLVEQIICIDGSERMLEVLRAKHGDLPNIALFRMDLEQALKKAPFKADLAYCFGLLEHIIDVEIFIRNCRSMLRNGGRMIFITPNARAPWYGSIRRLLRAGRHCSSDRYYTKEEIDYLMTSHGFRPGEMIYWGYFPAGVGNFLYHTLNLIGKVLEKTWLKRYAGGLTVSYVLKG
jgi:SAM-dependent methyltransferase